MQLMRDRAKEVNTTLEDEYRVHGGALGCLGVHLAWLVGIGEQRGMLRLTRVYRSYGRDCEGL